MSRSFRMCGVARVGLAAAIVALLVVGRPILAAGPKGDEVGLFEAIQAGQLEAKFIARDSTQARLLLANKTNRPLSVALPATFAAVPVLAQFNDPFNFNQGNQGNNAPQDIGGGFPPLGNGQMNVGGPGGGQNPWLQQPGIFNIQPEKVGKLKLQTVCLSFGQPEPRAKMPYEIRPLAKVAEKPGLAEVCAMLAGGKVSQRVAQLAAWHLANGKPWEELAGISDKAAFGTRPRYTKKELATAKDLVKQVIEAGERPNSGELSQK